MNLVVYNSQSRKKEKFEPLTPGEVKIYVCGPTVYNLLHVGNFRGPVFFNFLRHWLEFEGYKVKYALNFTDVDDRIIEKAKAEGVDSLEVSERYIAEYKKDFQSLGLRSHDVNPKVTEHMKDICEMVQELIDNKTAYAIEGEVLYSIKAFPDYGKLSGRNPEELMAGARVEIDQKKKSPLDFALWKPAKPGEPSWPSPWGAGRPGWHIECSAMVKNIFGDQIDIHGGGTDLIFPHHENEIAQSEGASGKNFVKYWMHWHMLNLSGLKMSKSIGNIVSLREFVSSYHPEIYKYMILSVHYRSISDFGEPVIEKTVRELARMYSALGVAESVLKGSTESVVADVKFTEPTWKQIYKAINDDFNTPEAFAALFDLIRSFNSQIKKGMKASPAILGKCQAFLDLFSKVGRMMALFQENPDQFLKFLDDMLLAKMKLERSQIDQLVKDRWQARLSKDFKRSDELREQLLKMGISVMDTQEGSSWEVTK